MILRGVIAHKKREVAALKKNRAFLSQKTALRQAGRFYRALKKGNEMAVIAEIKRRSPSKGILRKNFDPVLLAKQFEKSGASALSVLTDERYFGGSMRILEKVRRATALPILRKDFIIDESQVVQAGLGGADAILLIAAILSRKKMRALGSFARRLGLDVLYEVHTAGDLKKTLPLKPKILGVNNRDLRTFEVDLKTTEKLAKKVPKGTLLVSESGIRNSADILNLKRSGVKAVLVGESLMKKKNAGEALKKLLRGTHGSR